MTLTGMATSAVSILIVPVSSTVTGVLSARGRLEILFLSDSSGAWPCFGEAGAGAGLRPDCAGLDELNAQTNPATTRITTKQRANELLFIIPPIKIPVRDINRTYKTYKSCRACRPPGDFCSFVARSDGKGKNRRA